MTAARETLLPVLIYIQTNLDADLSLASLSAKAGLSPFHFHRIFKAHVGESPKQYTQRLRLERAAFRLMIHENPLLDIALGCGFQNHETFTRAFQRHYGRPPQAYRNRAREEATRGRAEMPALQTEQYGISSTRVITMRPLHLAFLRHVGPYEQVPESLFDDLARWREKRRLRNDPLWIGIGHDAPSATPPELLRFDAAVEVPGPFVPNGGVAYQHLPGGEFAVTTHAGSYATLPQAYAQIFPRVMALSRHRLIGLPVVELYRTARVSITRSLNQTDICLPVESL